jgi:hypothetical protein
MATSLNLVPSGAMPPRSEPAAPAEPSVTITLPASSVSAPSPEPSRSISSTPPASVVLSEAEQPAAAKVNQVVSAKYFIETLGTLVGVCSTSSVVDKIKSITGADQANASTLSKAGAVALRVLAAIGLFVAYLVLGFKDFGDSYANYRDTNAKEDAEEAAIAREKMGVIPSKFNAIVKALRKAAQPVIQAAKALHAEKFDGNPEKIQLLREAVHKLEMEIKEHYADIQDPEQLIDLYHQIKEEIETNLQGLQVNLQHKESGAPINRNLAELVLYGFPEEAVAKFGGLFKDLCPKKELGKLYPFVFRQCLRKAVVDRLQGHQEMSSQLEYQMIRILTKCSGLYGLADTTGDVNDRLALIKAQAAAHVENLKTSASRFIARAKNGIVDNSCIEELRKELNKISGNEKVQNVIRQALLVALRRDRHALDEELRVGAQALMKKEFEVYASSGKVPAKALLEEFEEGLKILGLSVEPQLMALFKEHRRLIVGIEQNVSAQQALVKALTGQYKALTTVVQSGRELILQVEDLSGKANPQPSKVALAEIYSQRTKLSGEISGNQEKLALLETAMRQMREALASITDKLPDEMNASHVIDQIELVEDSIRRPKRDMQAASAACDAAVREIEQAQQAASREALARTGQVRAANANAASFLNGIDASSKAAQDAATASRLAAAAAAAALVVVPAPAPAAVPPAAAPASVPGALSPATSVRPPVADPKPKPKPKTRAPVHLLPGLGAAPASVPGALSPATSVRRGPQRPPNPTLGRDAVAMLARERLKSMPAPQTGISMDDAVTLRELQLRLETLQTQMAIQGRTQAEMQASMAEVYKRIQQMAQANNIKG